MVYKCNLFRARELYSTIIFNVQQQTACHFQHIRVILAKLGEAELKSSTFRTRYFHIFFNENFHPFVLRDKSVNDVYGNIGLDNDLVPSR